jgi:hypothetical protein
MAIGMNNLLEKSIAANSVFGIKFYEDKISDLKKTISVLNSQINGAMD